ncbi:acylneuraminate cytidylyltransferase [Flavobacterium saliperosum S13]|uniref:N-acylneuraminate cytidylyltransferase n=2 Tax=Flavobacterium saliperosum TaxID=329186 RepID=A0A1G4VPG6_9FLAO|nr:acylneuraminate cytidylyltransferase family protein [Flavobacterium saliperosum]ESU23920.1 acylneuraminate cytidylyltransferase [Flavobacterium saliperosum S13]SCX09888.1 N-acylneuraminate cytidylyltransferase [Flavobacterium saliperosum]
MKTIAIIPARGGSKRLPGKNIRLLGGIPLIAHSIRYAQQCPFIDVVYVSTDDAEIKAVALAYGAKVVDRPETISGDLEPTVSALKHVLENMEGVTDVVLLQATNPLRPGELLNEAFRKYEEGNYDSLFTVTRNHQKLGKIIEDKFVPFNYEIGQRSQDLEPLYFENGLLYISKAELILKDVIISENACPMIVNHPFANVDIDTQEDFDYAEYLFKKDIEN